MCAVWRVCGLGHTVEDIMWGGTKACRQNGIKYLHACKESTSTEKDMSQRLVYSDPCFVFFRGETAQALTSPKTCTSKNEPLFHLHKCSTMDPGARRNVNLLMISALHRLLRSSIAWARLKLFCWGRKHIHVGLTECAVVLYLFLHICCITLDLICWAQVCYCSNHYVLAGASGYMQSSGTCKMYLLYHRY